ncbi:MAG: polysaccharide biosynthesis tyrosine autokinase [Dehalococcoidia bacterium]|jgi:capsular exopolysaccharide synthesis family protein|nr:MAG: polysaccharide biosynthesis tyrosine autokinase [Dehalococcoidia bacterium]
MNLSRSRHKNREENLYAFTQPKSPVAESFRALRTNITFAALERPCRTLLVASVGPGDGKSTVTANLGVVTAQAGSRVLIIDCDLRKPVLHRYFEVDNHHGLTNLLAQDLELPDVVCSTGVENLWVLTSGPVPPNPSELLGSQKMKSLLGEIAGQYDRVLIEAPPVVAVTDAAVLAPVVDGVVLVVKSGSTRIDMARDAKAQLEKASARIIGVILNEVKMNGEDSRYYYYYEGKDRSSKEVIL